MIGKTASLVTDTQKMPWAVSSSLIVAGDHANIHCAGDGVGHAFACAAALDIELNIRMKLVEFICPDGHHGIERERAGNRDGAAE